jgi:hypothetical protein
MEHEGGAFKVNYQMDGAQKASILTRLRMDQSPQPFRVHQALLQI